MCSETLTLPRWRSVPFGIAEKYAAAVAVGEGAKGSDLPDFDFQLSTKGGTNRMIIILLFNVYQSREASPFIRK